MIPYRRICHRRHRHRHLPCDRDGCADRRTAFRRPGRMHLVTMHEKSPNKNAAPKSTTNPFLDFTNETYYERRPDTPRDIAENYLGRGWNPVPVGYRKKKPYLDEWQNLIITEDNIGDYFSKAKSNIGVQLG